MTQCFRPPPDAADYIGLAAISQEGVFHLTFRKQKTDALKQPVFNQIDLLAIAAFHLSDTRFPEFSKLKTTFSRTAPNSNTRSTLPGPLLTQTLDIPS